MRVGTASSKGSSRDRSRCPSWRLNLAGAGTCRREAQRRPGRAAGALRVAVTAPPERGKANEAIQTLLAEVLKIKPSRISLLSGPTVAAETIPAGRDQSG